MNDKSKKSNLTKKDITIFVLLAVNIIITILLSISVIKLNSFNADILPVIQGKQELLMSEKIECYANKGDSFSCEGIKRESQQIKELQNIKE